MKKHGIQNLGHDANRTREKLSSTESNGSNRIERGEEGAGSRNIRIGDFEIIGFVFIVNFLSHFLLHTTDKL